MIYSKRNKIIDKLKLDSFAQSDILAWENFILIRAGEEKLWKT